jgi:hypothetical protein
MRGDQLSRHWRIIRAIETSPNELTVAEVGSSVYLCKFKTLPSSGEEPKLANKNIWKFLIPHIPFTVFIFRSKYCEERTLRSLLLGVRGRKEVYGIWKTITLAQKVCEK